MNWKTHFSFIFKTITKLSLSNQTKIYPGPLVNEAFIDFSAPVYERSSFVAPITAALDTPKCWKTIYHLLDLYAPSSGKAITHR